MGDRKLEELYREQFAYVLGALRHLGVRPEDLEDLVHEVFVIVHRRLADFDDSRPVRPWLFGIAYRVVAHHRERGPASREIAASDALDEIIDPASIARSAAREAWDQVQRALDQLDLDQRAVVVLHDLDGYTAKDIATALGIPENTVYSRLRLGREKLVTALRGGRR